MAEAIRGLTSLQRFNINKNGLTDDGGGLELFDAIQVCTQLQSLTFCENSLGPAGATLTAAAVVGGLTRLRELHVSGNRFGADGISRLAEMRSQRFRSFVILMRTCTRNWISSMPRSHTKLEFLL